MRSTVLTCGLVAASLLAGARTATAAPPAAPGAAPAPVSFTRDIKPILSNNCFACHGPDEKARKAKLRLDVREAAVKKAIVPGDAAASSVVDRIVTDEPKQVMPPPATKKPKLSAAQAELVQRWINEGAKYDQHWAYVKPVRPAVPAVDNPAWVRNPIDAFVAAGQRARGVAAAPEADRVTLIRRLTLDLTGLPPTPAEVAAFVNDKSPEAFAQVVDRLLSSKAYGERMAMFWLDQVRYADTCGYHSDNHRDVWLYRDYVIDAFNANKPFDRFTVEQIAGDLLPEGGTEAKVASGYNRLLQTTEEGGAQPKEYTAKYAADRVRNVATVWLAGMMGCAECHDHKYDPFTMKDFYSLAAFFADVQEAAVGRQPQTPLPTPEQAAQLKKLDEEIGKRQAEMDRASPELDKAQAAWEEKTKAEKGKGLPKPVADALAVEAGKRSPQQKEAIKKHFRETAPELEQARKALADAKGKKDALVKSIPTTLVTTAGSPRTVRILPRGNWLDDSGAVVQPAVPAFLGSVETAGKRSGRMELAKWLVSKDNPLTARVFVNRLWKITFGQGLVKSADDFGIQGAVPTHPELLDWLAVEFVEQGWDVKGMLRLMVTSNAYRMSSAAGKELLERDPTNAWLARQGRYRLDAEVVRDNALAVSGLLSRRVGGPSVKPYQPAGYWAYLNFPTREWQADGGDNVYRRGLYTYWCRTFLHPSLLAFDAPTREECTAERARSSTPLQALVLLNDPIYVEAARVFAERAVRQGGATAPERIGWMYRQALTRAPRPEEVKVLVELFGRHLAQMKADKAGAEKLVATGQAPVAKDLDAAELAAWTSVARVMMNLHEAITRN